MDYQSDKRGTRRNFDSVPEMARYIENTRPTWGIKDSRNADASERWDLKAGYDASWGMARYGWTEGAAKARKALKAFRPRDTAPNLKVDFYGHMPHVARYCAGAPDSMIRHAKSADDGGGAVLTLYVGITANCSERADCMSNYGLAIAQYINQLEQDGTRVELHAGLITEIDRKRYAFTFRVKNAGQHLDLAILAFAVGHPATFRRLGFALVERSEARQCHSYGRAMPLAVEDVCNPAPGAVFLNGMMTANSCAPTPEAALEHLTNAINEAQE